MTNVRRKPPAPVTRVRRDGSTVLEIEAFDLRARVRAAELGLRMLDVAARMGIRQHELSKTLGNASIQWARFERLDRALESPDWTAELPSLSGQARRIVAGLFRRGTRKSRGAEKTFGVPSDDMPD